MGMVHGGCICSEDYGLDELGYTVRYISKKEDQMGQEPLSKGTTTTRERTEVTGDKWRLNNAMFQIRGNESADRQAADLVECCREI